MEAASRSSLEPLPDLPVEEPLETAAAGPQPSPAVVPPTLSAAPETPAGAKDATQTGITFLDPAMLVLEPGAVAAAPAQTPVAATPAPPVPEVELTLEDPVVEELLTSPPPAPAKPAALAAPTASAAAKAVQDTPRDERAPIMRTASLTAAATKSAATKLAAASKRSTDQASTTPAAALPVRPATAPKTVAKPAEKSADKLPEKPVDKAAPKVASSDGLAGWTNARASAAPSKPKAAPAPAPKAAIAKPAAAAAPAAAAPAASSATSAPMDRDFIARNQVVERYLSGRLPLKGATEFEQFVHRHPEILDEIGLPERVNAGLRLLEASGKPEPWQEPARPSWQKPQVTLALGAAVVVLGIALSILTGTSASKTHRIEQLNKQVTEQPLDPATSTREIRLLPSRSGASNSPAISIGSGGAQLADFKIDESRSPFHIFRVTIDRIDQGRVGVITNLVKDSNGNLRIALNSSALGPGNYQLTIEGLNWRGDPEPDSWVTIGLQR